MAQIQGDPWTVQPRERARYEEQFKSLQPINGHINGSQAKGFMLQSQLPPVVLGQIWSLADTDADGKMDISEFSIACKLINLKLRGFEIPTVLPPALLNSVKNTPPAIPPLPTQIMNINQTPSTMGSTIIPPRPQPPKPASNDINLLAQQPIMQPNIMNQPPLVPLGSAISTNPAPLIQPSMPIMSQPTASLISGPTPSLIGGAAPLGGLVQPTIPAANVPGVLPPSIPGVLPSSIPGALPSVPGVVPSIPTSIISTGMPVKTETTTLPALPSMENLQGLISTAPISSTPIKPLESTVNTTPRNTMERIGSIESPMQIEWAVPHQTKLKFTQLFNTTDRSRSGYLSGPQARNLMLQSKLPHAVLAQIWALADMDSDGRLGCDEFVLAMYLCEQATMGKLPPAVLPTELIPPAFRRASVTSGTGVGTTSRHGSISSQGSQQPDGDPASSLPQTTFEDKRKENFEKGQAELERRRRALLEAQRAEAEARERKEREEQERKERAKAEQERKRQLEIQQQLQEQLEKERQLEEERKRQQEQREAARREMERQRQLEWEKQRSQELQQQRQRSQENVLKLKARNQTLSIELNSLTDQVKELSQKICNTRVGVSNVKTTIDGMRATRDTHMQELSQLKTKLKEQNARLIALSQEKLKLDTKNKMNLQNDQDHLDQTQMAFDNKEIIIKQLKDKLQDMEEQIGGKLSDIENNNLQLNDLTQQLNDLVSECEVIYNDYEAKKEKVLQMKNINNNAANDYQSAWKDTDNAWNSTSSADWGPPEDVTTNNSTSPSTSIKYRAIYEFVARNQDEISFQPGDIIMVPPEQNGEPGWLAGEIRGHLGWFPESYVEPVTDGSTTSESVLSGVKDDNILINRPLEGIAEVPEVVETVSQIPVANEVAAPAPVEAIGEPDYYVACYPYNSIEQGDLSFNAGDVIIVLKKEGEWWTGQNGDNIGIFPSNYVQKADMAPPNVPKQLEQAKQDIDNAQNKSSSDFDAEISAINDKRKSVDKSPDFAAMGSNTMTLKNSKKPEIATVLAPYQATSAEQLTLSRGQLIMIRKKSDSGWWEGELQAKGRKRQVGWFPATYVKVLESSGRNSGRNTPVSASKTDQQEMILDKVIALFPYTAQNVDELTFTKDDIISVTAREEPDWWRGELNGVSGLFPSNYVGPLQSSNNLEDKKRLENIYELINSQKQYLDDLLLVIEVFENPIEQSQCINVNLISKIFINWRDILYCDQLFYQDLMNCESNCYIIGDVISAHVNRMTPYTKFCSKQLSAASLLQHLLETSIPFRNEVKKCQNNPKTKGMPLSSFLIKPMQRITKYPLFISKILKHTDENHPDYYKLKKALVQMEKFCQEVNESVRRSENTTRLKWLQKHVLQSESLHIVFNSETKSLGPRQFIHYGVLIKVKSGKELLAFLFNDFLLLTLPSRPINNERLSFYRDSDIELKIYKQPFLIEDITLYNDIKMSSENLNNMMDKKRLIVLKTPNKILHLFAVTTNDCTLWIKQITEAKQNAEQNKITIQAKTNLNDFNEDNVVRYQGRLLINVMHGMHFQRQTGKIVCENVFCKVIMDKQEHKTESVNAVLRNNTNGKISDINNGCLLTNTIFEWNAPMQFHVHDIKSDILQFYVYENSIFTPDYYLGKASIKLWDIYNDTKTSNGPLIKQLILKETEAGEIVIKLDMQIFNNSFLN